MGYRANDETMAKKEQHSAKSSEVRISFAQDSWCELCSVAKSPKRYATPWYKPLKGMLNLWRLLLFKSYTSVKDRLHSDIN